MKLYHGSAFNTPTLKPGIHYSGTKMDWDNNTESNEWLYASTQRKEAIILGFFSYLEKHHNGVMFRLNNLDITIESDEFDLAEINIFLYEIEKSSKWIKVNNVHNGSKTEYKTKDEITPLTTETVSMADYLFRNGYRLKTNKGKEIKIPDPGKHPILFLMK